jgi:hypothetical protein
LPTQGIFLAIISDPLHEGKLKISDQDELIHSILEPDESLKEHRKNWSRLI